VALVERPEGLGIAPRAGEELVVVHHGDTGVGELVCDDPGIRYRHLP
jgi:hypothetical protein